MRILMFLLAFLISCGASTSPTPQYTNNRDQPDQAAQVQQLEDQVLALQGTIAMINAFASNPYTTCEPTLPPFEAKICQIAQTAVAEGDVTYFSSLATMAKVYQTALFGTDCLNTSSSG